MNTKVANSMGLFSANAKDSRSWPGFGLRTSLAAVFRIQHSEDLPRLDVSIQDNKQETETRRYLSVACATNNHIDEDPNGETPR